MGRTIPMPSIRELPDGPRRDFVAELRRYYRAAGRPPLRKISQEIERHHDPQIREITASAETIRRMITGKVLPVERDRVYAVFRVLCKLAEIDPEAQRWTEYDNYSDEETNWQALRRLWDNALEEEADAPPLPQPSKPRAAVSVNEDPWASDLRYSDEPPF